MNITLYDDGIEAVDKAKIYAAHSGVPLFVITMTGELPEWAGGDGRMRPWYRIVSRAEWTELDEETSPTWRTYWSPLLIGGPS